MKILVLWRLKDEADLNAVEKLLVAEERFAWKIYLEGTLREHYESDGPIPAVSVLEMDSVEEAQRVMSELPIMKAGFLEPQYFALRPFTNWEVLFREEERVALRKT